MEAFEHKRHTERENEDNNNNNRVKHKWTDNSGNDFSVYSGDIDDLI